MANWTNLLNVFLNKKEVPENKKRKLFDRLFKFIAEKLMF